MAGAIGLRGDYDAGALRAAAKRTKDGPQARRLLALAAIYDGATRTEAAKIGGVGLQVIRDWVLKFNAYGAAVRLGVDSCYSRRLPDILVRLAATRPHVTVEVARAASCELGPMLKANSLDLMLCAGGLEPRQWPAVEVWHGPLAWIVSDAVRDSSTTLCRWRFYRASALRPPWMTQCLWRSAALAALQRAGRRYKIVSTSSDAAAWHAAARAGLAVTVSLLDEVPEGLRPARPDDRLPELPEVNLLLLKAREPRQPVTDALYAHILEAFEVKIDLQ
jgi:DNA-binding transcriptional LysR family regulator